MAPPQPFSGSYEADDCLFLLKPLAPRFIDIAAKEALIQSGQAHYSELISRETPPDPDYLALFRDLTARYRERLAGEVMALAHRLAATRPPPLTLVSLARAGTPIGALLQRALGQQGIASAHYSISIVRDRGIDTNALRYLLRTLRRPAAGLVFIDGWTAKGVITQVLREAIARWNATEPETLDPGLWVISDLGGSAAVAATYDDYAIPSGILNATVSGLVSRTLLDARIGPEDFHGCVRYEELREQDQTRWFLDQISAAWPRHAPVAPLVDRAAERRALTRDWIARLQRDRGIVDRNVIKPGVAEATRVLLRRVPQRLILRDPNLDDVRHLRLLAELKEIPVTLDPELPFNAAALIRVSAAASPRA